MLYRLCKVPNTLYGVGLSLHCYRSISLAPVRGSTHFLCRRKESKQRKRAHTASL